MPRPQNSSHIALPTGPKSGRFAERLPAVRAVLRLQRAMGPRRGVWRKLLCWLLVAFGLLGPLAWPATTAHALLAVSPPPVAPPIVSDGEEPAYRQFEGRLLPAELALFADAADGQWNNHSLLRAALVASGERDPAALDRYEDQLRAFAERIRSEMDPSCPARQRAQQIFEALHGRLLTAGYRLDATDLRRAFDQGHFNCVSASVLFICLAEQFDLDGRGLEIPGHAMARLLLAEGPFDVETTCRRWQKAIGATKATQRLAATVEGTTGRRLAQSAARGPRREVTDVELVATIFYNRGVDLLAAQRYEEAVAANAKALRLDPRSETAWGNLLATLNNWAIACGGQAEFEQAVDLLRQGLSIQPDYETFMLNYVHVHHQWTERLCENGQYEKALALLSEASERYPHESWFQQALADVYHRWTRRQIEQ